MLARCVKITFSHRCTLRSLSEKILTVETCNLHIIGRHAEAALYVTCTNRDGEYFSEGFFIL